MQDFSEGYALQPNHCLNWWTYAYSCNNSSSKIY